MTETLVELAFGFLIIVGLVLILSFVKPRR